MRHRHSILGALCAAILLGQPLPDVRAESPWLYGIHWYGDPATSTVEDMTGSKGIWTLETVLPYSDPWWQAGGQLWKFQQIVARGHTIICRLEPNWGSAIPLPGDDFAQYLADVHGTAQTLASVVHVWQIGNEMNLLGEWGGNVLDAATYVDAFKQIRSAIRSVNSPLGEQIVLVGPVSPGGVVAGIRHTDGNSYLSAMCSLLTSADFDGFALHAYAAPWHSAAAARAELQNGYAGQLGVIDSAGFTASPIYMTEWNRRVEPLDGAQEAESAIFLHGAFSDLHTWNQTPGAHPIAAACWFIYADDPGWQAYSIAGLHGTGPSGVNQDLWDAFQYACTLELPAGVPDAGGDALLIDALPAGTNIAPLSASVASSSSFSILYLGNRAVDGIISASSKWVSQDSLPPHWLRLDLGQVRNLSGMVVRHAGAGGEASHFNTESFQLETAASADGPWDIQALVANPALDAHTARAYRVTTPARHVRLWISDPGVDNIARIPEFEVYEAPPGDLDANGRLDADEMAALAACLSGPQVASPPAGCNPQQYVVLDADRDGSVSLADVALIQRTPVE